MLLPIAYAVVVAAVVAVGHHYHMGVQPRMGSRIQHTGRQKQLIVLMGNDHHDFTKICDFHFQSPLHRPAATPAIIYFCMNR